MRKFILSILVAAFVVSCGNYEDEINKAVKLYSEGDYDSSCQKLMLYAEKGSARAKALLGNNIVSGNACGVVLNKYLPTSKLFKQRIIEKKEFRNNGGYESILGFGTELVAQAANEKYHEATYNLATLYAGQVMIPALKYNKEKTIELYKKSAMQGNPNGALLAAVQSDDVREQLKWYTIGAENGNFKSMQTLVNMYLTGTGVEKDVKQAKHWLKEMINKNSNIKVKRWARSQLDLIYNPRTCINC